jgi:hypothetical protein
VRCGGNRQAGRLQVEEPLVDQLVTRPEALCGPWTGADGAGPAHKGGMAWPTSNTMRSAWKRKMAAQR